MSGAMVLSHPRWACDSAGGAGDISSFVADETWKLERYLDSAQSLDDGRDKVLEEMVAFARTCTEPGWDGYGADPVRALTLRYARQLVEALPRGSAMPTVGAEPDGDLTLEWYHNPNWILSVSVSPEGTLHYAASLGDSRTRGSEPFLGQVPGVILHIIRRFDGK